MDILVWLMEESVSKSVSVTLGIAVMLELETSTWGTAGITMYTNLFLLVVAVTATVALTKQDYCEISYPVVERTWWKKGNYSRIIFMSSDYK